MQLRRFNPWRTHPDDRQRRGEAVLRALPIMIVPLLVASVIILILEIAVGFAPPVNRGREFGAAPPLFAPLIPIVVLVIFASALVLLVRLGRPTLSALALIGAWTLFTTLAVLTSSVTSFAPALLLIPIVASGLVLDGSASISLATLATILAASLGWLQAQGLYPEQWLEQGERGPRFVLAAVIFWSLLYWTIAVLTSLLAGSLKRALRESREHAAALDELRGQLEVRVSEQTAELARRAERAEALYETSRAVTNTHALDEVLALIGEQASRQLGFAAAVTLIVDTAKDGFAATGAVNLPGPLPELTAADGELLHALMVDSEPRATQLATPLGSGPEALVLPLHYDGRQLGVLALLEPSVLLRSPDDLAVAGSFASQAAMAIANAQFLERAREAAILGERTRLAHDIHDTLAQGLTGIVVLLGASRKALTAAPDEAAENLDLAQRMAREALAEARRSVWNMRSDALARGTLGDALASMAAHPMHTGTAIAFTQRGDPWEPDTAVESALLRIAQEALVNVAKHARASHVTVDLIYGADDLSLTIRDDGVGFAMDALRAPEAPSPWHGFGLLGMRERLAAFGGSLELRNAGGALVVATVPRAEAERSAVLPRPRVATGAHYD